ncbi:MAG: DedA family protein [Nitrososphaeraceae archaeon]
MNVVTIESFVQWVISLVSDYLYAGIFTAALIETIFPPIPSEIIFPLAGYIASQNGMSIIHVIVLGLSGAAGSTAGAFGIYLIARKLGRIALLRYLRYAKINEARLTQVDSWFEKHGAKAVLFARMVPGLRELISIPAGVLKMKVDKFLIFTFAGSCVWSVSLTLVGYYFGIASLHLLGI